MLNQGQCRHTNATLQIDSKGAKLNNDKTLIKPHFLIGPGSPTDLQINVLFQHFIFYRPA